MGESAALPIAAHGERKFAVLMFADLTGYTELCRRLDPEDVAATVRPVMASMKAAVEAEGGVVPSVAGDGFMAVFGIPHTDEHAAVHALQVARGLRALTIEANRTDRTFRIPDVHIGIAAGEVLVVPSDEPVGWSLVGNPVNLAARLCDAAGPGEVFFDNTTRDLFGRDQLSATPHEIRIDGVADALTVWMFGQLAEDPPQTSEQETPFVNRVSILRRLDAIASECSTAHLSRAHLVVGEAGIGKTRTLQHWLGRRPTRHAWVWGGATGGTSALTRFVHEVGVAAGIAEPRPTPTEAKADQPSPLREDPFPAAVVAAREVIEAFAAAGGAAVVIDDAHLADPSLIEFLLDLRERPVAASAVILATWRSDEAEPPWSADVVLEPLGPDESATLFADCLGAQPPSGLRDAVLGPLGGHPLMTVQSAAYLVEAGVVDVTDGQCQLRRPEAIDVLPTSLRLYVAARVDRLAANVKAALQELSTFGEQINRRAVEQLCGRHVHAAMPRLVDRGFLVESEAGWRFAHGLVQQVAYASLPRSVRAELHRRQAQFHHGVDTGAWLRHATGWAECTSPAEPERKRAAVHDTLAAAEAHAVALYATQGAAAHSVLRQAAALLEDYQHLFPTEAARLHTINAQCLLEMGRFEDALMTADRALDVTRDSPNPDWIPALLARGHALSRLQRYQAARQSLEEALNYADERGDSIARGRALRLLGDTWRHTSYSEFVRLTEEAYRTLADSGDQPSAAECASILAYLRSVSTQFDRWREIAASHVTAGDLRGQLWLARADLEAHHIRRADRAALAAATEAVRLARVLGSADGLADGLAGIARSATAIGNLAAALQSAEELRSLAVARSNPRMRLVASTELILPLLHAGRLDEALKEMEYARSAVANFGASDFATVSFVAAAVARDQGRWLDAATELEQLRSLSEVVLNLEQLAVCVTEAIVHSHLDEPPTAAYVERLAVQCVEAGAPRLASLAFAIAEQRHILEGDAVASTSASHDACLEELAIRADSAALLAGQSGLDPTQAWQSAAEAWKLLGYTVFLARAQARSGDISAAEKTLEVIGADATARQWALQG